MCGQNGANSGTTCRVSMNALVTDYGYQALDEIILIAQAENEVGFSPLSDNSIERDLVIIQAPATFDAPRLVSKTANSVNLVWNGISQAEYYELVWNILGEETVVINNIETNSYAIENLQKGKTYEFRVRGHNDCGSGLLSE